MTLSPSYWVRLLWGRLNNAIVDDWFADINLFFISGMGRSGTQFLAQLLATAPDAAVYHEPFKKDFDAIVEAQDSDVDAHRYIDEYRKYYMYAQGRESSTSTYGEVNSALRYHLSAIGETFPEADLIHLVRDGRDVVRSLMSRRHYTDDGEAHHNIAPKSSAQVAQRWSQFDRFQKICWLWADAVDQTDRHTDYRVRLEDLTASYDYFNHRLEEPLNLNIGRHTWSVRVDEPENSTDGYAISHWTDWPSPKREQFATICGDQMRKMGYW